MKTELKPFKLRVHVGPSIVESVGKKMREAGIVDVLIGTETVYCLAFGEDLYDAIFRTTANLERIHGTYFGLKFRGESGCRF